MADNAITRAGVIAAMQKVEDSIAALMRLEPPELVHYEEYDDEEDRDIHTFECPWCGDTIERADEFVAQRYIIIRTTSNLIDTAAETFDFPSEIDRYEAREARQAIVLHGSCEKPVSLPRGWSQYWW